MRLVPLFLCVLMVGCGAKNDAEKGGGGAEASFSAAQAMLDGFASKHTDLKRLTLHAVPAGKSDCIQVASTMASRRGKPSDAEDLDALQTGKEVVLEEPGAIDVTVPILMMDGKPTAVVGVTLALKDGADRDARVGDARSIAQALEKQIQAAKKPLW